MGRPSDKKRSAGRPGKRQRARVKKPRRTTGFTWTVVGGDLVAVKLRAGRKKWQEATRSLNPENPWSFAYLMGNHIPKVGKNG